MSRHTLVGGVVSAALALIATLGFAAPALATPVATSPLEYDALGRVFPDPLAGCQLVGTSPCDPNAQGNVAAAQFIQIGEFTDALEFMNSNPDWQRYLEVQVLDGQLGANGEGQGVTDSELGIGDPGSEVFPGNNLPLEYDPRPEYRSAGLPTNTLTRNKSDLIVVRVTDETVPDVGKKRYALSLSIHGIERAGVEGGTRAMEDLVTAATTGRSDQPVLIDDEDPATPPGPSFKEVLEKSIVYFTYPNPDGWRRGSVSEGGFFFQRYNGNGVDVNRDWPDIGFSFRPYSGLSEPESRGLAAYMDDVEGSGGEFALGDDLHGQPEADALSYTLLPHGRHDFAKDQRIRSAAIAIHRASETALSWSPIIQPNDAPQGGGVPCVPGALGDVCAQIYGQTWGTVYDTINYTTTGALGDYFDSSIGLNADGIDNEMSFSHLDKNIVFDPHTEQLHVAGNKALIFARLAEAVRPRSYAFVPAGTQGYVPNVRVTREERAFNGGPPAGTAEQADVVDDIATIGPDGTVVYPFTVKRGPQDAPGDTSPDAGKNIFNGGMRIDATAQNVQGVGTGVAHLAIQCRGCDEHPGVEPNDPDVPDDEEWITVTEDYNQSPLYAQAGVTAAVNRPQAFKTAAPGEPVEWRAVLSGNALGIGLPLTPSAVAAFSIDFSRDRATTDGATGGDDPPVLAGYDIANTDFFPELNRYIEDPTQDFRRVNPGDVISGNESLSGLDSLVLADDALPGYTGPYGPAAGPGGPPTADFLFEDQTTTVPGAGSGAPGTYEEFRFTIAAAEENASVTVRIEWSDSANDFDLFLYREEENGDRTEIGSSAQGGTTSEEITVADPGPGNYVIRVDNWASLDSNFTGTAAFEGVTAPDVQGGTGAYTVAQKDAWFDALTTYVRDGGNLVLTDGALRGITELTEDLGAGAQPIPTDAVARQTVYVGQTTFDLSGDEGDETGDGEGAAEGDAEDDDPLAANIDQDGARFNSGHRRQTFEPTPLGFSIQNQESGLDESHGRQYDVDRAAWEAAGGRTAGTSANSGERDAAPVYDRVTLGELSLGSGQIRIAGALLPQPTEEFDHPLGLEPFAVTYTGYIVLCNLLGCEVRSAGGSAPETDSDGDGVPDSQDDCPTTPGSGPDGCPASAPPDANGPCANRIDGTGERDKLRGTGGSDRIIGKRGNDRLKGRGGDDCLLGKAGRDKISGNAGGDDIRGGGSRDKIKGNGGRDVIRPGRGKDKVNAGGGRDIVRAARGSRDVIDCGPGKDTAFINERKDTAHRCEKVKLR